MIEIILKIALSKLLIYFYIDISQYNKII